MKIMTRKKFLTAMSLLTLGSSVLGNPMKKDKNSVIHQVFFWLKNPSSTADRDKLIEGLQTLRKIEMVHDLRIGVPADTTPRPVIDSSYQVSETIFFDDATQQNAYQDHPIHKKFVENYSSLWDKVIVYDSRIV
jgi:Stress responsive A/B Barrel Domain